MPSIPKVTAFGLSLGMGACAIMPDLPPDWAMPQRDIVLHAACELQTALRTLDGRTDQKRFDARNWTIRISLNPKVDADIVPGAGLTRRVPTTVGVPKFTNWVFGGGSGLQLEMKGQRTGNLDFVFDSAELIDDDQLKCHLEPYLLHALTKEIGIRDWLFRAVEAAYASGSSIDKPSFSSDVLMKFGGNGNYAYTFPPGTNLVTLAGFYQQQQTLNINLSAKPRITKFNVVTLPQGGQGFRPNNARVLYSTATAVQDTRSDLQQIEQAIRNLRSSQ